MGESFWERRRTELRHRGPINDYPTRERFVITRQARTVGCRLALLLLVSAYAAAQSPNLKSEIEHRWKGKIFFIKGWYDENELTYDASGSILSNPKPGPWTAGAVQIHSVKVKRDK